MARSSDQLVVVRERCGAHCIAREDAEKLFNVIVPPLRAGHHVDLDFSGIETLASSFLNVAIGRLYGTLEPVLVDQHLRWHGLDDADQSLMLLVIRNAKDHYRKTASQRAREEEILRNLKEPEQ